MPPAAPRLRQSAPEHREPTWVGLREPHRLALLEACRTLGRGDWRTFRLDRATGELSLIGNYASGRVARDSAPVFAAEQGPRILVCTRETTTNAVMCSDADGEPIRV